MPHPSKNFLPELQVYTNSRIIFDRENNSVILHKQLLKYSYGKRDRTKIFGN